MRLERERVWGLPKVLLEGLDGEHLQSRSVKLKGEAGNRLFAVWRKESYKNGRQNFLYSLREQS